MEDLFSYHKRYSFVPYKIVRKHEISEKNAKADTLKKIKSWLIFAMFNIIPSVANVYTKG